MYILSKFNKDTVIAVRHGFFKALSYIRMAFIAEDQVTDSFFSLKHSHKKAFSQCQQIFSSYIEFNNFATTLFQSFEQEQAGNFFTFLFNKREGEKR